MLTDASNTELDRINAKAQERRDQSRELGAGPWSCQTSLRPIAGR